MKSHTEDGLGNFFGGVDEAGSGHEGRGQPHLVMSLISGGPRFALHCIAVSVFEVFLLGSTNTETSRLV